MDLTSYFAKCLSNIQPSSERVTAVSNAHTTLRDHLQNDAKLKWPIETSRLAGSYGRDTATDPIKDADIILGLQHKKVSADAKEPNPVEVLSDLKSAIQLFYDEVEVRDQRRSIRVKVEGASSDETVYLDVVPAVTPDGIDKVLWVPDRDKSKWIKSNPIGYVEYAGDRNSETDGRYVKLVKALKWWASLHVGSEVAPKSFLLEVMTNAHVDTIASNLPRAFAGTVSGLVKWLSPYADRGELPIVSDPTLKSNDLAQTCRWSLDKLRTLVQALSKAQDLADRALRESDEENSIRLWRELFGDAYPERLSDEDTDNGAGEKSAYLYRVRIRARLAKTRGAEPYEVYPSGGRRLPKGLAIRFEVVECTVPGPYGIKWQVTNHGKEARDAEELRHHTYPGGPQQWETTKYRGHHFMDCEIWQGQKRVAAARHHVNIA